MKRILGIFIGALAVFSLGATAVSADYPPAAPTLTATSSPVAPGASFTITGTGCAAGAVVTFKLGTTVLGTAVAGATFSAALTVTAPQTPGTYTYTSSCPDGKVASLNVTVPVPLVPPAATPLPATGTDTNSIVLRAGILVLLGAGLVGAAMVRRRSGTAA